MKRFLAFLALATTLSFAQQPSYQASGGAGTGTCTNQAVTSVNNGAPTCTTLTSAYMDSSVASKSYVDNAIAGVNPAVAVRAATATVLPNAPTYNNGAGGIGAFLTTATLNTALVVDGVTLVLNDRVLVKDQASSFQNGVYFVSQIQTVGLPWILTRALDFDTPSDMNSTGAIPVVSGTVNASTQWVMTSQITTVGTDAATFTQFSSNPANQVLAVSPGAGICRFAGSTQTCTSSELSGDATTSASNAVTLARLNVNATANTYIAGGGSAQAQTATLSPALTANTTGAQLTFLPTAANTAAGPTLAVNGLTAKTITKCGTVALVAGDLSTTQPASVIYDGTEWVLRNPMAVGCPTVSGGYISTLAPGTSAVAHPATNVTDLWAFIANTSMVSSAHFSIDVTTVDNSSNLYNWAVFCAASDPACTAGTIICQTGAIAGSSIPTPGSTGLKIIAWTGACGPFHQGQRYYLAMTNVTSTMIIGGTTGVAGVYCGLAPATNNTTSSAVWTTPITYSADTNTIGCNQPNFTLFPN